MFFPMKILLSFHWKRISLILEDRMFPMSNKYIRSYSSIASRKVSINFDLRDFPLDDVFVKLTAENKWRCLDECKRHQRSQQEGSRTELISLGDRHFFLNFLMNKAKYTAERSRFLFKSITTGDSLQYQCNVSFRFLTCKTPTTNGFDQNSTVLPRLCVI